VPGDATEDLPHLTSPRSEGGPRVSIIMPTFRRSSQIGESILSLLRGEYQDFELLVRDDGDGTDGTEAAVAAAVGTDNRVRYHLNAVNLGIADNLNAGILESRGEFISVCHDHDLYRTGFLKSMVAALDRHPSALYVHCASDLVMQDGTIVARCAIQDFSELTQGLEWLKFMLSTPHCPVCALTLVRRVAHEQYGLYNPAYGFITDVDMWMRLSAHGDVAYVREPHLLLREREEDHQAIRNWVQITQNLFRIHVRHVPCAYNGWRWFQAHIRLRRWRNRNLVLGAARSIKRFIPLSGQKDPVPRGMR
jgi:glycosyltransferase involved in cell wall biosynthesis